MTFTDVLIQYYFDQAQIALSQGDLDSFYNFMLKHDETIQDSMREQS